MFKAAWTEEALRTYRELKHDPSKKKHYNAIKKTIKLLLDNPRHPGLHTHEYHSLRGPKGEKVFEAYTEQKTPAAYRVFWYYGPSRGFITIIAITPHP